MFAPDGYPPKLAMFAGTQVHSQSNKITLNADLGESWYDRQIGNDVGLMPHLDLCNIACGFHGGDTLTMYRTLELAVGHGVRIGAHPSFPDRKHFGRRRMQVDDRLFTLILYQVAGLDAMKQAITGSGLHHLKPHGALYHYANENAAAAEAIVSVMAEFGIPVLIGPPAGELRATAERAGRHFWAEGFADRRYEPSLHLRPRQEADACIEHPDEACTQALLLASGKVMCTDGKVRPITVDTLCLHGDHAGAALKAYAIRMALDATSATPLR